MAKSKGFSLENDWPILGAGALVAIAVVAHGATQAPGARQYVQRGQQGRPATSSTYTASGGNAIEGLYTSFFGDQAAQTEASDQMKAAEFEANIQYLEAKAADKLGAYQTYQGAQTSQLGITTQANEMYAQEQMALEAEQQQIAAQPPWWEGLLQSVLGGASSIFTGGATGGGSNILSWLFGGGSQQAPQSPGGFYPGSFP